MKFRSSLLLLLCAAAIALPVQADEDARKYGPGVLKPDQVKQCLRDRNEMVALHGQLVQEQQTLAPRAEALERVEAGLVRQQTEIGATREELIRLKTATQSSNVALETHLKTVTTFKNRTAYFNAQVKTYNEGVTEQQANRARYNEAANSLNARLAQYGARADEVNRRCAGITAYQEDISAAQEQLGEERAPPTH